MCKMKDARNVELTMTHKDWWPIDMRQVGVDEVVGGFLEAFLPRTG